MAAPLRHIEEFDLERVSSAIKGLLELQEALCDLFPEREDLIQQLIYALLMREHVLIYGTFGTGKSDLVRTLFQAITNTPTDIFSMEFSKGTTEAEVFGVPDVKRMREEGILLRRPDGTLRAAYFAELDEFLDATTALLRAKLGVLNERRWRRGQQVESVPLRTAVASTNQNPLTLVGREPVMAAVLDRFLFWSEVKWLSTPEARVRMFQKFLRGEQPRVTIDFAALDDASDLVVAATEQLNIDLLVVYEKITTAITNEWASQRWRLVSDRTRCRWLQVAEAHALLEGRFEVQVQDFLALRWAVCEGGKREQFEAFERVVRPIIDEALAAQSQSVDDVQRQLLRKLESEIPAVPSSPADNQLVPLKRALLAKSAEVEDIKPQLDDTKAQKRQLQERIQTSIDQVQRLIDTTSISNAA